MQLEAFRASLREHGFEEGRNLSLEVVWGNDQFERMPVLAEGVVARKPEVIVTATSVGVLAFKKATNTIPIVFATAGSPVEQGFVASLPRPGGNITGVLLHSGLTRKLAEVARDALPSMRRIAILIHDTDPARKVELAGFEEVAADFKLTPLIVGVSRREDIEGAFATLAKLKADALIVPQLAMLQSNRKSLIELALKAKLPLMGPNLDIAEDGGLLSYGTARDENFRRAGALTAKILRGAKPGELPVEQPEKFQLIVNLKTARAINVRLSEPFLLRADKVIE